MFSSNITCELWLFIEDIWKLSFVKAMVVLKLWW
ncbi:hypothetical protein Q604_UNBC05327G0001, partial [human gut metagenome]